MILLIHLIWKSTRRARSMPIKNHLQVVQKRHYMDDGQASGPSLMHGSTYQVRVLDRYRNHLHKNDSLLLWLCVSRVLRHLLVLPSKVQAKLNMRAYAFVSDVVDALGDALFVAAPQHFKLESAVSANELLGWRMASILQDEYNLSCAGTLSIRSERSPFRLLMMDGPTRTLAVHM